MFQRHFVANEESQSALERLHKNILVTAKNPHKFDLGVITQPSSIIPLGK